MSLFAPQDTKLRALAERVIGGMGKLLTFEVRTKTPDATTGATTLGSPTSVEWKGIVQGYDARHVDGELIQAADVRATIFAKDITFTPELAQKVTFDSTSWRIVNLRPRFAGEQLWGYTLHLRRG